MIRQFFFCCGLIALFVLGCGGPGISAPEAQSSSTAATSAGKEAEMHETGGTSLVVGSKAYALQWADTTAASELRQQLPLAKTFTELHGNEKYYKLSQRLTAADEDVREIHKGDVMLFDGQYVVVFYQDFQTIYRYTRLGHVEAADDLDAALGAGDVFLILNP